MSDNIIRTITECMWRFERANSNTANLILLGYDEWFDFTASCAMTHLEKDGEVWYRGCRMLRGNEPGIWVGHCVTPLK